MEDAYPSSYFASNMEIVHKFSLLFSLETPPSPPPPPPPPSLPLFLCLVVLFCFVSLIFSLVCLQLGNLQE